MLSAKLPAGGAQQLVPVGAALEIFDIDRFPDFNHGDEMSRQQQ